MPPLTKAAKRPPIDPQLTVDSASIVKYAASEKADSTRRAYRADWKDFSAWCTAMRYSVIPAEPATVAAYFARLADTGTSASTISRRAAAIAYAHKLKGHEPPTSSEMVRVVLRGIRRRIGTAVTQKAPATASALAAMLAAVPSSIAGLRDRALLLIGFAAALRRSELVDLKVNDIEITEEGAIVHLARSKTDQEGAGADIAIPRGTELKPVEALETWLAVLTNAPDNKSGDPAQNVNGPIFRPIGKSGKIGDRALSAHSVAEIVKRHAAAAGLDPTIFSGHSLRAGFVTSALEHGADLFKVMDVTRHRRVDTLKGYDRRARAFRNHAGKDFL